MGSSIDIKFWGVRGSTPCANPENMRYGGNTTCVQVELPEAEELVIFDCGTGLRNLGNEINGDTDALRGRIFITHPHWDHLQGFPFFKPFYGVDNWFRIYMPPQGEIGCKEILQGHMSNTFFPVSMDMLEADLDCETIPIGKKIFEHYSLEYIWATHTVPTAIYKINVGDNSIVFCPDNELKSDNSQENESFLKTFREFIHGADVLIHDAQYSREQYKTRKNWGHSAWENVLDIAIEEDVKNLVLTHHDPDNDDNVLSAIEQQAQEKANGAIENVSLAKEGQIISLPF